MHILLARRGLVSLPRAEDVAMWGLIVGWWEFTTGERAIIDSTYPLNPDLRLTAVF